MSVADYTLLGLFASSPAPGSLPSITVRDLIRDALQELGILQAGETPSAEDAELGFSRLNYLVDEWATERLTMYAIRRSVWNLVSGTAAYTIGPGGDCDIARPVYVQNLTFQDTSVSPTQEYRWLNWLTPDAYAAIPQKSLTSTLPSSVFYNPTYPLATATFWMVPTSTTLQGVIYPWVAVPYFASLDEEIALPPGYRSFLLYHLALRMVNAFAPIQPSPNLVQLAMEAKAKVKRANEQPLTDLTVDLALQPRGRYFNIFTGEYS